MKIKVVAYGIARDILGGNHLDIEIETGQNVENTLNLLKERFPDFNKVSSLLLAVNESYVANDFVISEGDELVLIPPVSGG